jgi:hypothetical protein
MPATKTAPKATRSREAGAPAHRTIKAKQPKSKAPQPPARTPKDWKDEERNEDEGRSVRGAQGGKAVTPEQIVVGDNYSIGNWGLPTWQDDDGNRLIVSYWFPTQKVAIDYPYTKAELKTKEAVFKKLKVAYIGVLPGEPLEIDKAQAELRKQGAKI